MLFVVSVVATAINSVAGGGGLLTFPVLMTVLPPVTADATSAVALLPAYMTSTWAGRKHLAPVRHWFWRLLLPSLLGSLLGALLLSWSGNRSFTALIPWLILIASLLILRPLLSRTARFGQSLGAAAPVDLDPVRFTPNWCDCAAFLRGDLWRIFWRWHRYLGNCRARFDWVDGHSFHSATQERLVWQPPSRRCNSLPFRR